MLKRISIFSLAILLFSCKSTFVTEAFLKSKIPAKPDYQKEENWAVLPSKYPDGLKEFAPKSIENLEVDVFYVYPTLLTNKKDIRWNVAVSDEEQNEKVLNTTVKFQASAWATSGTLYVPYYRQAHYRSYSHLEKGGKEALLLAYSDVRTAFKTYLEKYNNGRPIIIAAHSQGTTHILMILKEFFDGKPLQKQLIAAYLPGMAVKKDEFKNIKPMTKPNETGGFVSWNTFKKGHYPKENKNWYKGSITTNPITWDITQTTTLNQHKGFLYSNGKLYKNALKVEITDGLVWSTNPKFPKRLLMSFLKNYHVGDVNLFWQDIRENAELRTKTWLKNKKNKD